MSTRIKATAFFEKELGPMSFGSFLTAARNTVGLSQSDLARRLKVSRSMICDVEKGRVLVSPRLAVKIARLTGFPEKFAVKYCLQDQLRKAKIRMSVNVDAA
jgi:DNA-binding XRE family transcriptional regulator